MGEHVLLCVRWNVTHLFSLLRTFFKSNHGKDAAGTYYLACDTMEPHRRDLRRDQKAAATTGCNGILGRVFAGAAGGSRRSGLMSGTSGAPAVRKEVVREMSSMGSMTGRVGARVS